MQARHTIIDPYARWNVRRVLQTYKVRTDFAPADRLAMCWSLFRHGQHTR